MLDNTRSSRCFQLKYVYQIFPSISELIKIKWDEHTLTNVPNISLRLSVRSSYTCIYLFLSAASPRCDSGICWATKACFRGSGWPCMLMKTLFSLVKLARRVPSTAQRELANSASAPAKQAEVNTSQCQLSTPRCCKQTLSSLKYPASHTCPFIW